MRHDLVEAINRIICGTKLCLTDSLWLQALHWNANILLQTIVCFIDIFLIDMMYVSVSVCSYLGKRVIIDTWCVPVSICLIGLKSVLVLSALYQILDLVKSISRLVLLAFS